MKQFSYVLTRPVEPHARPISSLIREAAHFSSRISIEKDLTYAIVKKAADVLRLKLKCGNRITVIAEGCDEEAAIAAMQNLVVAQF